MKHMALEAKDVGAIVGVIAIGLFTWHYIGLKSERDTLLTSNATLKQDVSTLETTIKGKDLVLLDLQKRTEEQNKRLSDAIAQSSLINKASANRVERILSANVSQDCMPAMQWAIREAKEVSTW